MNDRLPGTTWDNPIWHIDEAGGKWRIYIGDRCTHGFDYEFTHDNYDPTPLHIGDGPGDHRHGFAHSVHDAKRQITEDFDALD